MGVFHSWSQAQAQVSGFSKPVFKKFNDYESAKAFCHENSSASQTHRLNSNKTRPNKHQPGKTVYLRQVEQQASQIVSKIEHLECKFRPPPSAKSFKHLDASKFGKCLIYCDGASRNNGAANAVAGYGVCFDYEQWPDCPYNAAIPFTEITSGRPTNQTSELLAIRYAVASIIRYYVEHRNPVFEFEIVTDSMFAYNCLTDWKHKWMKNGWTNGKGAPVVHAQLIKEIDSYFSAIDVGDLSLRHVNGHNGDLGNTVADKLANIGCDRAKDPEFQAGAEGAGVLKS